MESGSPWPPQIIAVLAAHLNNRGEVLIQARMVDGRSRLFLLTPQD